MKVRVLKGYYFIQCNFSPFPADVNTETHNFLQQCMFWTVYCPSTHMVIIEVLQNSWKIQSGAEFVHVLRQLK